MPVRVLLPASRLGLAMALLMAACLAACSVACSSGGEGGRDGGAGPIGDIGQPCANGDPLSCAERICLSGTSGQTYCSAYCSVDDPTRCPEAFPCQRYVFGDASGAPADLRDVCAPPCERDAQCQSGRCELPAGTCAAPAPGVGAEGILCGAADGVCKLGLVCDTVQNWQVCVPTCDPEASAFCDDGSFCWAANLPRGGSCWPGGTSEAGDPCSAHLDCALGLLCILQNGDSTCRVGCDPEGKGPGCINGAACLPLEGRIYGFCQY